jgi:hypothetical protein
MQALHAQMNKWNAKNGLIDIISFVLMLGSYPSEHMSSSPVFARSVGLYILLTHHCVSFCPLSFGHCIISSSSVDGLCLPRWYARVNPLVQ